MQVNCNLYWYKLYIYWYKLSTTSLLYNGLVERYYRLNWTELNTEQQIMDLMKVINYDTNRIQRNIILIVYFHSKQGFPAPKQTKWVNIKDAQSPQKLFQVLNI